MQLTSIVLLAACLSVSAATNAQKVSISGNKMSLHSIFNKIRKQTGYNFIYANENLEQAAKVSLHLKDASLKEILNKSFAHQPLSYKIDGKMIIVKAKELIPVILPPPITVTGTITDSLTGVPLVGVSIKVKGGTAGAVTDANGQFSLEIPDDAVLEVSYLGYTSKEVKVDGRENIDITLAPSSTGLNEIVVTALGIKSESKKLGYAVQKVSGGELQTVKGVDVGTSLTGKVSGLVIRNSTEFDAMPNIELRGETPMIVLDGVPYENLDLRDIPSDNIKEITVLKGPTAAALYGSKGANGAIMITTKSGKGNGLSIDINSNTMFQAGYLTLPKVQTSYAHGIDGHISTDYVWGPKLDIGDSAMQWNPVSKREEMMPLISSGKNNLKNFMQPGFVTNNDISVTQSGERGYFRAGINHIYDKGQWPNTHLNIINYTMSGELKIGDKFNLQSHMGYTFQKSPQIWGRGYGTQGYIYQILMWSGPDYDIRQYRDYWVEPYVKQNWLYTAWYDNPYLIAYQKLDAIEKSKIRASITANYQFNEDLKLTFRSGYDYYKNEETVQSPAGINSTRGGSSGNTFSWNYSGKGMFGMNQLWGFSTNNDLMLNYNKNVQKFNFDILAGGSIAYFTDREMGAQSRNGLAIPGWYSLANAVPSTTAGVDAIENNYGTWSRQINSLYGKASIAWNGAVYLDITGRNDWSSTQPASQRSYFYPSVSSSIILSELFRMPRIIDLLKIRGSWTEDKLPAGIYANNQTYSNGNSWGLSSSSYPGSLLGANLLPSATRTWETGIAGYLLNQRLHADIAYFNKYYYNQQTSATISSASGFTSTLINTDETYARRGLEITIDGSIIKNQKFEWHSLVNYSFQHRYYVDIDPIYSADNLWTKKGARLDSYISPPIERTKDGQIINNNGFPELSDYDGNLGYTDPDFSFGFINNFKLGHFSFGISIDGRIGGIMYDYVWNKMFDTGANIETDTKWRYDEVVNGLTNYVGPGVKVVSGEVKYDKYGRITKDTREYAANDVKVSYQAYEQQLNARGWEHGLKDQSFIKLREISIGYNIPNELLKSTGIKNASVSLTAQNVLMWTNFPFSDPDVGDENMNAPSIRMVGLNIKIGL